MEKKPIECCARACRIIEAFHDMEAFSRLGFFLSNGIAPLGRNSRQHALHSANINKLLGKLPPCSCLGAECLLPRDDWAWHLPFIKGLPQVQVYGKNVIFHPEYAFGTAAIRGNRMLTSSTVAYWEVHSDTLYNGTSIMYGIGTYNAPLFANYQFTDLLGSTDSSYGLSHKGWALHDGLGFQACNSFPINGLTRIGIFFNGPAQTLSYFINDDYLCTPFTQINTSRPLYPMISSTCQQSTFYLQNQYSWSLPISLYRLAAERVHRMTPSSQIKHLPLPLEVKKQVFFMSISRSKPTQTDILPQQGMEIIERLFENYYK